MPILQTSDFGTDNPEWSIPQDNIDRLTYYIVQQEKDVLIKLLGAELYDLFIVDYTVTPFIEIFNPFHTNAYGCTLYSKGIKEMLKSFVYFHAMRNMQFQKTKSGVVQNQVENGNVMGYNGWNVVEAYNKGVKIANVIQYYITENITLYPTYKGDAFTPIYL